MSEPSYSARFSAPPGTVTTTSPPSWCSAAVVIVFPSSPSHSQPAPPTSRAARTALPLLEKASRVVILAAPGASSRSFDPDRLQAFFAARNVAAEIMLINETGDAAQLLLDAATKVSADILVAGAFGHPRLQEYIFGGTPRTLLNNDGPSLFLSH